MSSPEWLGEVLDSASFSTERVIAPEWTVPRLLGPGSVLAERGENVLATGALIALLEDATWQFQAPHVPNHLALLGCGGTYRHRAPSVVGQRLSIELRCAQATAQRQTWITRARTEAGVCVAELEHDVATVDRDLFQSRLLGRETADRSGFVG